MKNLLLEAGYGRQLLRMNSVPDAPTNGWEYIITEVESVMPIERFKEQLDLELLQRIDLFTVCGCCSVTK
ncbi:hypothetical protein PCCS19_58450 [Paenibacillus sp. CCS19]|nr:hypothetical protein PCCS19_58450 [Paenibacillus cellulosilyticus]